MPSLEKEVDSLVSLLASGGRFVAENNKNQEWRGATTADASYLLSHNRRPISTLPHPSLNNSALSEIAPFDGCSSEHLAIMLGTALAVANAGLNNDGTPRTRRTRSQNNSLHKEKPTNGVDRPPDLQ